MSNRESHGLLVKFIILVCLIGLVPFGHSYWNDLRNKEAVEAIQSIMEVELKQNRVVVGMFITKSENSAYLEADKEGNIIWWNNQAIEYFGDLRGKTINDLLPANFRERHEQIYLRAMLSHSRGEPVHTDDVTDVITKDGTMKKFRLQAWSHISGGGVFLTKEVGHGGDRTKVRSETTKAETGTTK